MSEKVLVQNRCFSMAQVVEIVEVNFTDQQPNLIKSQVTAKYRFLGSWRVLQSPRTSKLLFHAFYKGLLRRESYISSSVNITVNDKLNVARRSKFAGVIYPLNNQ